jgi:CubicO group peptidase (beta-lactamase class C family)
LNGEILRRITVMSAGQFIRTQIAVPLNADVYVGLNAPEMGRAAEIIPPSPLAYLVFRLMMASRGRMARGAFTNPARPPRLANTRRWREAEIPSSNGHASAHGLARLFKSLDAEGRITSYDWGKYNSRSDVVFRPKQMRSQALLAGYLAVTRRFYSLNSILKRLSRSPVGLWWTLPLNLAYHIALRRYGFVVGE